MSEPSIYVLELQRLHAVRLAAESDDEREMAEDDLARLMRLHAQGRDGEYFDVKAVAARNDA